MTKKETYICDRCMDEIDCKGPIRVSVSEENRKVSGFLVTDRNYDLCEICFSKFDLWLNHGAEINAGSMGFI